MKNKINKIKKDNLLILIITVILFLVFLLISYFVPLTGDDWTNANFKTSNILRCISIAYDKYFTHEGRFMSRIFVLIFTNTKWLWNITNALMVASIYYISMKLIRPKNFVLTSILMIFSMIILEETVFTQSYLWVTGNVTYYLPMFLLLLYIYLVRQVFNNNFIFNKITIIISLVLNILIPTMIEHISVALVCVNIFLFVYSYIKTKKINKFFLATLLISIIGFLFIYLSPGANIRAKEMEFYHYSIIDKIFLNIPNFINYTYVANLILIILILIIFVFYILKNYKGCTRIILFVFSLCIPILQVINIILKNITINSSKVRFLIDKTNWITNCDNIFIISYWVFATILLLIINLKHTKKTNNYMALFFYFIGIIANIAMLLSPIWGGRTALFTIMFLSINILILLQDYKIKNNKIINVLLYLYLIYYVVKLLILYNSVHLQQLNREKMIKKQIDNNSEVIHIERFPNGVLWNPDAWNKFHEKSFKIYYGIDEKKTIVRDKVIYEKDLYYRKN